MGQPRPPPPDPARCLVRLRSSTQKGGTLIAEDVIERAAHERRLHEPDGYRPSSCARCGDTVLHVHDYRERRLRAEPGIPVLMIVRYICAHCAAIWQTLPAFVARHLWRSWKVVEHTIMGTTPREWPPVPTRTQQRWSERIEIQARVLVQVLAASGGPMWSLLVSKLAPDISRRELVDVYSRIVHAASGERLASLSALVYRLAPKVRLM